MTAPPLTWIFSIQVRITLFSRPRRSPPASRAGRRGEQLGLSGCKFRKTFLNSLKFVLQEGLFVTESLGFIGRGARCRGPSITERANGPGPETPAGPSAETAPPKAPGAAAEAATPELSTAATAAGATGTEAPSGARTLSHRSSSIIAWHGYYLLCPCSVGHWLFHQGLALFFKCPGEKAWFPPA
jgi:hypothetical protein